MGPFFPPRLCIALIALIWALFTHETGITQHVGTRSRPPMTVKDPMTFLYSSQFQHRWQAQQRLYSDKGRTQLSLPFGPKQRALPACGQGASSHLSQTSRRPVPSFVPSRDHQEASFFRAWTSKEGSQIRRPAGSQMGGEHGGWRII